MIIKNKVTKKMLALSIISMFLLMSITVISVSGLKTDVSNTTSDQYTILFVNNSWTEDNIKFFAADIKRDFNLDYDLKWHRDLWSTIQEAIDTGYCDDGDTVYVFAGEGHYGYTVVDKSITLQGEDPDYTMIKDAQVHEGDYRHYNSIQIKADNVKITGFTFDAIDNAAGLSSCMGIDDSADGIIIEDNIFTCPEGSASGIEIENDCNDISVLDNTYTKCFYGIWVFDISENILISDNIFSDNAKGIYAEVLINPEINHNTFEYSLGDGLDIKLIEMSYGRSEIIDNTISYNGDYGLYIHKTIRSGGTRLLIKENTINNNGFGDSQSWSGVKLGRSDDRRCEVEFIDNTVTDNSYNGLSLRGMNCEIRKNNFINNGQNGTTLSYGHGNIITDNTFISNNMRGIHLRSSDNNIITHNDIENNRLQGILLDNSDSNQIYYNNFIDNYLFEPGNSAKDYGNRNEWDDQNGQGNYWSDYEEWYKSEYGKNPQVDWSSHPDEKTAITWKDPYRIYSGDVDNYPWINEDGAQETSRARFSNFPAFARFIKLFPNILPLLERFLHL